MKTKREFIHSIGYLNCTNNHIRPDYLLILATTKLTKLLTSCITCINNHAIKYRKKSIKGSGK